MKIKPITKTIKATALCNPNPSFVSQVKAGANQRPFRAMKMDAAVPVSEHTEEPMKIKQKASATVTAIAPKGYGVAQFEFSKEKFADEAAVKAWMDAGGYTEYTVVETTKGFEVSDSETGFETGSVMRIDGAVEGLSVFVGKVVRAVDEDPAVEEPAVEDVAKAAAVVEGEEPGSTAAPAIINPPARQRVAPEPVEGEEPAPVVEEPAPAAKAEGDDAPPAGDVPAVQPVAEPEGEPAAPVEGGDEPVSSDAERAKSMVDTIGQTVTQKGVYEAAELGRIVNQLGWIVYDADYSGMSVETVDKIKTAALALLEAFMQASTDAANELTEVFRTAEEQAARAAPEDGDSTVVEVPTADIAALVADAVARAMEPIQGSITEANDRTLNAERAAQEAVERAEKAEQALAEREQADALRGQTRKGAEDLPVVESTDQSPKVRSDTSNSILRGFGSRHAR